MAKFNESEKAIQSLNEELEKLRKQTKAVADENIRLNETIKKQSTSVDDLNNKNKQLDTTQEELIKLDKQMSVVEAKLTNEYLQVKKAVIQKQEAEKKANEEIKRSLGISKQAQQEEKKLASERAKAAKEKEKQDKKAFANSREGIRQMLIEKQARNNLINEEKKALGIQNKFVGGIKSGITQFGLWLGAITGGTVVLKKFLTGVKDSAQFMSDQWNVTIAQGRTALETFQKALASPNGFRNFFSNLKESLSEIRKYVKELDELGELNRELRIQEQKARQSLAEQAKIFRSSTASVDEKREATEKYIQIQRDLADTKEKLTKRAYENEISNLIKGTELTKEQAKAYIENYSALDPLVKKAIDFLETQRDLQPVAFTLNPIKGWSNAISGAMNLISGETSKEAERLKELAKSFDNTGKAGEDAFKQAAGYLSFSEEAMNKTGAAAEAYFGSLGQFDEKTLRAQLAQDRVNETAKKGIEETNKVLKKSLDDRIAAEGKALREIDAANAESAAFQKEIDKNIADTAIEIDAQLNETLLDNKKTLSEKLLEIEKWLTEQINNEAEKRKEKAFEYAEFSLESAQQLTGAVSNLENAKFENEISQIEEKKNKEIEAAENAGKSTTEIDKKYDKQIRAIKKKQAAENKKAAKFSAVLSGANIVLNALKTEPFFPLGLAMSIVAGVLTGLQIAAINKEPVPFKDGTHGPLKESVYAKVAEQGQEYWRNKKLGIEGLTPKFETKAFIPEGTEIFPAYSKETKEAKERVSNDSTITELRQIRKALSGKREKDIVTRQGAFHIIEQNNQRTISRKRLIN